MWCKIILCFTVSCHVLLSYVVTFCSVCIFNIFIFTTIFKGFLQLGYPGTRSHHPFIDGFSMKKQSSYGGTPIGGNPHIPCSCCHLIPLVYLIISGYNRHRHSKTPIDGNHHFYIWWFPKIGVPPVIIHSSRIFHEIIHIHFEVPRLWKPPFTFA